MTAFGVDHWPRCSILHSQWYWRNDFDVVLMDIHMPGISGIEATQEIRKFKPQLPIIALTAVTIEENLDEFYRVAFNEIIPKPFKTEEFFEKIHRSLTQDISAE